MTPIRSPVRHAPVMLVLLGLAPVARAVQPHAPAGVAADRVAMLGEPPRISPAIDADESKQWAATDPAFRAFVAEAGVEWSARWDRRTGHLSFASGSFPAWLPADHRARHADDIATTRALLEQRARALMAAHPGLLGIPPSATLILDTSRSVPVDDGRLWQIDFRVELDGVPVEGAHVSFRLNHGRLVQLGQMGLADALEIADVTPRLDAREMKTRASTDLAALLGDAGDDVELVGDPRLELLPLAQDPHRFDGAPGAGMGYRLAWRNVLRDPRAVETWVMLHDAVTGERLFVFDSNRYACTAPVVPQGRVVGGVYTGPIETTPETLHALPHARVSNGGSVDADINGIFPFVVGNPATTTLSGRYFDMNCSACSNPPQALATSPSAGPLSLGIGGNDNVGNGLSTKAERNCFYHLNVVRQMAAKHLSDAATGGFLGRMLPATVNIAQACNAFWNGNSVNFYQASARCNNTGEIADVMQHEWGHGLDANTGGINDSGMSEGMADVTAFLTTHDPRMGPYFYIGDAAGIRNADEVVAGTRTWTQVDALCPGREEHCVGEIFSQPWWHLARNLRQRAVAQGGTEAAGWFLAEKIFFQHLPLADTMDPAGANNMYDAATLVDDDDGDLTNGVPDGTEINDAFSHHAFVSPPAVADSPDCVPPAAPVVTLSPARDAATANWQIAVSWTAVPGAAEYRVFRNETGGVGGEVQVATILAPGLTFRDDGVADATTYYYRVLAFLANGCFSIGENAQSTTIPDRLVLSLDSLVVDDANGGNGNGSAEPGERLVIAVTVRNGSTLAATDVQATMTSPHPGVMFVQDAQAIGDIAPGASAGTTPPHFILALDPVLVACPDAVPLSFSFEAVEGCSASDVTLAVGPPPRVDDLETDGGWTVNPNGTDTATTGIWVRAVPIGTSSQVSEDHTPGAGDTCFVTGNLDSPMAGADDVDNGCTTLASPVYDLGGQAGVVLSYWRAFDIQAILDDVLVVEISNDGGGAWTELERVAASTGGWALATFPLDAVFGGPAARVRLRFTACDTGGLSLIEAAVDDIALTAGSCEPPDARPRLSVAGLIVGDSAIDGGAGNGDGALDPGERVRLPIDLFNGGNAPAGSVQGVLSLLSGDASVSDASTTWADIGGAASQRSGGAPAHFEIAIPPTAACGSLVDLAFDVSYDGPSGSYSLRHSATFMIGRIVETDVFADDFESAGDNGATHAEGVFGNGACAQDVPCDDWQHGACTGTSQWDPQDTLVPGGRIWGNDLGAGAFDGNFRNNCCSSLELASIDCRGFSSVKLGFLRWLTAAGVGMNGGIPGDQARILVRRQSDVGFTTIWQKTQADDLLDVAWTPVEYDITALAAGDPGLVIRFEIETDDRRQRGGWNIDDLRVFDRSAACTLFDGCGAPPIPPAVGPVLRATDRYDDDGAEYSWTSAVRAADEEFRLYRGTVASDVTTLITLPGHVASSYDDRAAPGPLYFYRLVLANCLGQEGPADP